MTDVSSSHKLLNRTYALMCMADEIEPVGGESVLSDDEKLAALTTASGFSELIMQSSGVCVDLVPGDFQVNAERVISLIDALNGHASLFNIVITDNAATVLPANTEQQALVTI